MEKLNDKSVLNMHFSEETKERKEKRKKKRKDRIFFFFFVTCLVQQTQVWQLVLNVNLLFFQGFSQKRILLQNKVSTYLFDTNWLTIAYRFSNPLTLMGTFENFWSKASDMLCAGSVEMINTDSRALASCTAKLQLQNETWLSDTCFIRSVSLTFLDTILIAFPFFFFF